MLEAQLFKKTRLKTGIYSNNWIESRWINTPLLDMKGATYTVPLWNGKFYNVTLCVGIALNKIPHDLL